jgi:hypothetical protein
MLQRLVVYHKAMLPDFGGRLRDGGYWFPELGEAGLK